MKIRRRGGAEEFPREPTWIVCRTQPPYVDKSQQKKQRHQQAGVYASPEHSLVSAVIILLASTVELLGAGVKICICVMVSRPFGQHWWIVSSRQKKLAVSYSPRRWRDKTGPDAGIRFPFPSRPRVALLEFLRQTSWRWLHRAGSAQQVHSVLMRPPPAHHPPSGMQSFVSPKKQNYSSHRRTSAARLHKSP